MFRGTVVVSCLLVLCVGLAMGLRLGVLRPQSLHLYERLMALSDPKNAKNLNQEYTAKQNRYNSQKNILFVDDGKILEMRLNSAKSQLVLDHQAEKTQIVEKMEDVICLMQEELYELPDHTPMQTIRYIKAKTASYYYKSDHFVADQVQYARYQAPGHKLPNKVENLTPLMDGVARAVEFSLNGKEVNFKAHQLKATFRTSESL